MAKLAPVEAQFEPRDLITLTCPCVAADSREAPLDTRGIECGIMGNGDSGAGDEAHGLVGVDPFASDIGIGDAREPGDLGRDRHARVFEPLARLADLDDHAACIKGDALDRKIDNRMIRVEANGFDIDDGGSAHMPLRFLNRIGP
jgi:hypothetical protein